MKAATQIFAELAKEERKFLLESEAKTICVEYGIPVTKFKLAKTCKEAVKFAEEIGYPVVLKIVSPDIIHKSDVGGVIVDIKTAEDVQKSYEQILENVRRHKADAR
ncbi:MAG: acetate--CoA ligase family protein, partial [Candidatus Bathyarchaeia archaeon]